MAYSAYETFLVVVISVLLGAHLVQLLLAAWRGGWLTSICTSAGKLFSGDESHKVNQSFENDPLEASTALQLEETRIQNLIYIAILTGVYSLVGFSFILWNILLKKERWMLPAQTIVQLILQLGAMILMMGGKRILSGRHLGYWYAFFMLGTMLAISLGEPTVEAYTSSASLYAIVRILYSLNHGSLPSVVLWNLTFTCGACFAYWQARQDPATGGNATRILVRELNYCSLAISGSILASSAMKTAVREAIRARTLQSASTAMTQLLHLVCDAVIELDADLKITEHVPKFAAMASFGAATESVKGIPLQSYMATDDEKSFFENRILASSDDATGAHPGAVHCTLRDGAGTLIPVELFYVQSRDVNDGSRYYVGIRASGERDIAPLAQEMQLLKFTSEDNLEQSLQLEASEDQASNGSSRRRRSRRRRRNSQRGSASSRGTPRNAQPEELHGGGSDAQSVSSGGSSRLLGGAIVPHAVFTKDDGMELSIVETMKFWNFSHNMCCHYHACLFEVRKTCRRLEQEPCCEDFGGEGDGQCDACGTLADLCLRPGLRRSQPCTVCVDGKVHPTRHLVQL